MVFAEHHADELQPLDGAGERDAGQSVPACVQPGDAAPDRRRSPGPTTVTLPWFVLLSVLGAVLTVATPVLAGRVVDEIVGGGDAGRVVFLAVVIALIAVLEAVAGIAERWQSAKIGEGLILDLRRACSATSSGCRSPSSPAPAPALWSAG